MKTKRLRLFASTTLAASLSLVAASGCRKEQGGAETPQTASPSPSESGGQGQQQQGGQQQDPDLAILTITFVDIDTRLATMCGIPDTGVYFKYDSANLSSEARERLDQIATCVTTGPAQGKELRIIGRTDPVGSDTYNQQLGKSRADAVGEYLRSKGVQAQRVDIESKGEEAAPQHPAHWPVARRVSIRLQD